MPLLRASLASSPVTAASSSGVQVAPRADGQGRARGWDALVHRGPAHAGRPVRDGQQAQAYRRVCRGVPCVRAGQQRDFVVEGNCLVTGQLPEEERRRQAALFARGVLVASAPFCRIRQVSVLSCPPVALRYHEAGVRCGSQTRRPGCSTGQRIRVGVGLTGPADVVLRGPLSQEARRKAAASRAPGVDMICCSEPTAVCWAVVLVHGRELVQRGLRRRS